MDGGFGGIGSRFHFSFFDEVAPALVMIRWALKLLKILQSSFGVLLAADDFDDSGGPISPDVMTNDGVGTVGVGVCQEMSLLAKS